MNFLTLAFSLIVIIYFSLAIYRTLQPLARLKRAGGSVREIPGRVTGHEGKEDTAFWGQKIETAYPVYSCTVDGNEVTRTGYVRLAVSEREQDKNVTVIYCPESREIWCKEDVPIMKKTAVRRTVLIVILVIAVVAVGFLP